jgi:hypothetical protein
MKARGSSFVAAEKKVARAIIKRLKRLKLWGRANAWEDQYLAGASDLEDLDRRVRLLECGGRKTLPPISFNF